MATMTAKYRGRCAISGAAILPGDVIDYKKGHIVLIKKNPGSDYSDLYVIGNQEFIRNAKMLCKQMARKLYTLQN